MVAALVRRDSDLREHVIEELKWDSRVDDAGVGVAVHDGVATLSGTVGSHEVVEGSTVTIAGKVRTWMDK